MWSPTFGILYLVKLQIGKTNTEYTFVVFLNMSYEDGIEPEVARQSSLDDAKGQVFSNLTQTTTTANGTFSPVGNGKLYPYFVPSTVKSTLGSPVS